MGLNFSTRASAGGCGYHAAEGSCLAFFSVSGLGMQRLVDIYSRAVNTLSLARDTAFKDLCIIADYSS